MPKKKQGSMGAWAFLIGVILAVIFAFVTVAGVWLTWLLVLVGIIVGLLNIADVEVQPFLLAGVVLVIVSSFGGGVFTGLAIGNIPFFTNTLNNLLVLFVPATIIVALKSVFSLARR